MPQAEGDESSKARPPARRRLSWAALLHRVLFIDALFCTRCGRRMKVISLLSDPRVVKRILDHLGLPSAPLPLSPVRSLEPDPRWEMEADVFELAEEEGAGVSRGREADTRAPP